MLLLTQLFDPTKWWWMLVFATIRTISQHDDILPLVQIAIQSWREKKMKGSVYYGDIRNGGGLRVRRVKKKTFKHVSWFDGWISIKKIQPLSLSSFFFACAYVDEIKSQCVEYYSYTSLYILYYQKQSRSYWSWCVRAPLQFFCVLHECVCVCTVQSVLLITKI